MSTSDTGTFGAPDPASVKAAAGGRPLPKRFYKAAAVIEAGEGLFGVALDGRSVRTPGKRVLAVPSRELAAAIAAEWAGQGEVIDPLSMPMTRLTNSALDGVEDARTEVAEEIVRYAGSDLLCYRADYPAKLVDRQVEHWDPVLAWGREDLGAVFVLSEGIRHVEQPPRTLDLVRAALPEDALRLAALNLMTTLSGSALLAIAVWRGRLSAEQGWRIAHIDEETQEEAWGVDVEALRRRETRARDFLATAEYLRLLGS